ncbi:LOW QUALITY PROTEIN: isoflavone 2'-hydroxylase-like protein [Cinnamomum micranthum f. kanehirae]|uniref:Isoflavone 2'-hydroxylase-like protein n=1 Tax=Cinnamomum micranthum f. kanehirae TaxID=337451 RepID=A0A3S3PGH6_9MAGN|nr:LOW QUALITY PROTEIN: isoflavone 2'-hydroxylase-like protein [Cinnamomum micranthum f. kanehirae]
MWGLGLLMQNQEAQQKLYQEIREHAGCNEKGVVKRLENWNICRLYCEGDDADETHCTTCCTAPGCKRYYVGRGCMWLRGRPFLANLYALHYDPKVWDEPERFKPERFLESSKEFLGKRGQYTFLPFWGWNESLCGYGGREASAPVRNLQPGQRFSTGQMLWRRRRRSSSRVSPSFSP